MGAKNFFYKPDKRTGLKIKKKRSESFASRMDEIAESFSTENDIKEVNAGSAWEWEHEKAN